MGVRLLHYRAGDYAANKLAAYFQEYRLNFDETMEVFITKLEYMFRHVQRVIDECYLLSLMPGKEFLKFKGLAHSFNQVIAEFWYIIPKLEGNPSEIIFQFPAEAYLTYLMTRAGLLIKEYDLAVEDMDLADLLLVLDKHECRNTLDTS